MNAHQTIGIVTAAAKMPARAPPRRLAIRIAGKNVAKHNLEPNRTSTSCVPAASAMTSIAATNAEAGLTLRIYSAPLRMKSPRKIENAKIQRYQSPALPKSNATGRKTETEARRLLREVPALRLSDRLQ